MRWTYKQHIKRKIHNRPELIPLFSSVHRIPERLYDYDNRFFLVYNKDRSKYEIHHLDQADTFCLTVPYDQLDARTIRHLWRNDIRVHGNGIFKRLEQSEENMKKAQQREFQNWVEAVAKDTQSEFAKSAWT